MKKILYVLLAIVVLVLIGIGYFVLRFKIEQAKLEKMRQGVSEEVNQDIDSDMKDVKTQTDKLLNDFSNEFNSGQNIPGSNLIKESMDGKIEESLKEARLIAVDSTLKSIMQSFYDTRISYFSNNNDSYYVSSSDTFCIDPYNSLSNTKNFSSNPVECFAKQKTFTARIKLVISDNYYCADSSGVYEIKQNEPGYSPGVSCK